MTTGRALNLGFLVWAFAFVGFAGTTLLADVPAGRIAAGGLFGVPMLVWALVAWRRPPDRLDAAVLLGVVLHLLVSFASLDPTASLEMSAVVVTYACVYAFARWVMGREELRRLLVTAVVVALLFWLTLLATTWIWEKVAAVQALGWPPPADALQPWVWGSVNTPPVLALVAGPFIAWLPDRRARRAATVVWVAASVVVVPLSMGRAGWLGIAVALVAAEVVLGYPALRRLGASAGAAKRYVLAAAASVVALVALLVATGRFGALGSALDSRLRLWDQALSLFGGDPLTGAGPSTFGWARFMVVPDYVDRVAARDVHSVPLQTLADGGVLLAAGVVVIAAAWLSLLASRWSVVDRRQRVAVAGLLGYAAFALLDDLSFLPSITVLLIVLAAWAIPQGEEAGPVRRSQLHALPLGVLLVGLATAPSVLAITGARLAAADGRSAAVAGDWPTSRAAFHRAASAHPTSALLWMSVGLVAARSGDTDAAVRAYARAREINPGDPRPWGALAVLAASDREAVELLDAAARRSNDPRYAYRLGDALARAGQRERAAIAFAHAVALWPDWWSVVPADAGLETVDILPDVLAVVGSIGGAEPREGLWNAQLANGRLAPDAGRPWQAVALAAAGDIDAAMATIRAAPSAPRTDQALAAVAEIACDEALHADARSRLAFRPAPAHPGDHPVTIGRSGAYRELELGDYQPIAGRSVPDAPPWPRGLVEIPDCGW